MKLLLAALVVACALRSTQTDQPVGTPPSTWTGQRIIMLHGYGQVHHADSDRPQTAVGINIVTPVARVDGSRIWVSSTGGDESGWLDVHDALLLSDAIAYFTARIEQDPSNWDAYLRRGEANHALNQRDAATLDYTKAIALHPSEAFLYLRRGRHYSTLRDCKGALHDFEAAIQFVPTSSPEDYNLTAELYSLESGIYAGCPDRTYRDSQSASPRPSVRLILTPRVRRF